MFRVLRWLTDASLADSIAGDLAEESKRRSRAPVAAALWFWRASFAVALYLALRKVKDTIRALIAAGLGFGRSRHEWRQALRSLRRTPWYSLTVIGVIALSMTLATTVFAIVDGVLFKPLPYPRADELYVVGAPSSSVASSKEIREWAAAVPDTQVAALGLTFPVGSTNDDVPASVTGAEVGPGFFDVIGTHPLIGGFRPEHFEPTSSRVPAIISYGLWQRAFQRDVNVVGQPLDLPGAANHLATTLPGFEVVGVLPRDFVFPRGQDPPEIILPIAVRPDQDANDRNYSAAQALVRVPTGVSLASVQARIDAVAATQGFHDNPDNWPPGMAGDPRVRISSMARVLTLWNERGFRVALSAAMVLVLIAAVNVASLAVARGRQRRRELALRQALGASRWQLVRLALQEIAPLVLVGTALGIYGAVVLTPMMLKLIGQIALLKPVGIDWRVLSFAASTDLAFIVVVLAMHARVVGPSHLGGEAGRGMAVTPRRSWSAPGLVAIQVALTMVLAVGGVLVTASLWWAWQQDPGIDTDRVVVLEVNAGPGSTAERDARFSAVVDRVRSVAGVEQVAVAAARLMTRSHAYASFKRPDGKSPNRVEAVGVGGEFFSMFRMQAIAGRLPTPDEFANDRTIVVVGERVAREFWPGQSAIGQILETRTERFRVVAVVRDVRLGSLEDATYSQVYTPVRRGAVLFVKGRGSAEATLRAVLPQIRSLGPPLGVTRALSVDAAFGDALRTRSFNAWFFGGFAGCALVIVGAGIVGLVAMTTALRTREMGIRVALGATRDAVVGLLLREQMRAVGTGILLGGLVAAWAVRYMKLYLYQFTVYDTRLWAIAIITILLTAGLGAIIPSLRASRVDPVKALRDV